MNKFIIALCFVASASAAAPSGNDAAATVVHQESEINPDGSFKTSYETSNGISAQQSGALKSAESEEIQGSYKYVSPDGTPVEVTYIADENGYQPKGSHIFQIPAAIARALEWIAAHPQKDEPLRRN